MGMTICKPTSITVTGTGSSASINTNGSVTFGTADTLLLNGVFSATYDNYMVSIRSIDSSGTTPYMYLQFASGGTADATTNSYDAQRLVVDSSTLSAARTESTIGLFGGSSSAYRDGNTLYIFGSFLTENTTWRSVGTYGEATGILIDTAGVHQVATSFDGLVITPNSGTITGLIAVYGFNQ